MTSRRKTPMKPLAIFPRGYSPSLNEMLDLVEQDTRFVKARALSDACRVALRDVAISLYDTSDWTNGANRTAWRIAQTTTIEREFFVRYPRAKRIVSHVEYRSCGGFKDPRGRYCAIIIGGGSKEIDTITRKILRADDISLSRRTTTLLDKRVQKMRIVRDRRERLSTIDAKLGVKSCSELNVVRYSGHSGLALAQQRDTVENGRITEASLHLKQSGRQKAVSENDKFLDALRVFAPDSVKFASIDRVGREYAKDAIRVVEAMGVEVKLEDDTKTHDFHRKPRSCRIQRQNQALDNVAAVHFEELDHVPETIKCALRRVGDYYLVKKERLALLGVAEKDLKTLRADGFRNVFARISWLNLIGNTQSYVISATPPPS